MVIVDTCVWSPASRRQSPDHCAAVQELRILIEERRVQMIGPIRQGKQFKLLKSHLDAFSDLPISTEDYVSAARLFNTCRRKGIQGSNTDFLICAIALWTEFSILTTDRDFLMFAQHIPFTIHEFQQVHYPLVHLKKRVFHQHSVDVLAMVQVLRYDLVSLRPAGRRNNHRIPK